MEWLGEYHGWALGWTGWKSGPENSVLWGQVLAQKYSGAREHLFVVLPNLDAGPYTPGAVFPLFGSGLAQDAPEWERLELLGRGIVKMRAQIDTVEAEREKARIAEAEAMWKKTWEPGT